MYSLTEIEDYAVIHYNSTGIPVLETRPETDIEDFFLYDITMNLNGMNIQPAEPVTVRLPVPEGFNPSRSFVLYIDTATSRVERMDTRVENGNITAKKIGTAVITATVEGTDVSATCNVTVNYAWWQWIIRILLLGFIWY